MWHAVIHGYEIIYYFKVKKSMNTTSTKVPSIYFSRVYFAFISFYIIHLVVYKRTHRYIIFKRSTLAEMLWSLLRLKLRHFFSWTTTEQKYYPPKLLLHLSLSLSFVRNTFIVWLTREPVCWKCVAAVTNFLSTWIILWKT